MKRWVLVPVAVVVAVVGRIATQESDVQVLARAKAQVQASCMRQGAAAGPIAGDRLEAFCRCSADGVARELGPQRLRALIDDNGDGGFDAERMASLSVQCFEDVVAKLPRTAATTAVPSRSPPESPPESPAAYAPTPVSGSGAKQATGGRRGSEEGGG